jgi:CheY-like chemotaxis protein
VTGATQTEPLGILVLGRSGANGSLGNKRPADHSAAITYEASRPGALALLRGHGKRQRAPRPALVLVDLDCNSEDGWTLLRDIKGDPQLKRIPVIVVGASNSNDERSRAYQLHANSYLARLGDESQLNLLFEQIDQFWLTKVRLPAG